MKTAIQTIRRAALALAAAGMTAAPAQAQTPAQNKAAVSAAFDSWKTGAGSPFELLADNASWTIQGNSQAAGTYPTEEVFLRDVIRPFNARMSQGLKPSVKSITAEDDRVVILFDAHGTARDGKPYANSYAWFFRMQDGRVVQANAFFDAIAFNDLWTRVSPTN